MTNITSKMSTSFEALLKPGSSSVTGTDADTQLLIENESNNAQFSSSRNRRGGAWSNLSFTSFPLFISSEQSSCFGISKFQRFIGFFICIAAAAFCFSAALMLLPVFVVRTRRFAALNTLGSLFFIVSFGFIWGPATYVNFLFSSPRQFVSGFYFLTIAATLFSSLWLKSTAITFFLAVLQGFALFWYLLSFLPGGEAGLRFITKAFTSTKTSKLVLPI